MVVVVLVVVVVVVLLLLLLLLVVVVMTTLQTAGQRSVAAVVSCVVGSLSFTSDSVLGAGLMRPPSQVSSGLRKYCLSREQPL